MKTSLPAFVTGASRTAGWEDTDSTTSSAAPALAEPETTGGQVDGEQEICTDVPLLGLQLKENRSSPGSGVAPGSPLRGWGDLGSQPWPSP